MGSGNVRAGWILLLQLLNYICQRGFTLHTRLDSRLADVDGPVNIIVFTVLLWRRFRLAARVWRGWGGLALLKYRLPFITIQSRDVSLIQQILHPTSCANIFLTGAAGFQSHLKLNVCEGLSSVVDDCSTETREVRVRSPGSVLGLGIA